MLLPKTLQKRQKRVKVRDLLLTYLFVYVQGLDLSDDDTFTSEVFGECELSFIFLGYLNFACNIERMNCFQIINRSLK